MKRFKKFTKVLLIIAGSFALLLYGTVFVCHKLIFIEPHSAEAQIESVGSDGFAVGAREQLQVTTMEEFILIFAEQIKRYNEIAPKLWPDNAVINQSVIAECLEDGSFWLITPDGNITALTKKEARSYNITANRIANFGGFSHFATEDVRGYYMLLSKEDLNNYDIWEHYLHLGTYDPFITYCHEMFHELEQQDWAKRDIVSNPRRDEYLDNTAARAKRNLLIRQLMLAVSDSENQEQHILNALATYEDYKVQFPDDYEASLCFDKEEGSACYFEIEACLYAAYPDKIKNEDDLQRAWSLLAARSEYIDYGLIAEGYTLGAFACELLDRLGTEGEEVWKYELMADPDATPMTLLSKRFVGAALPDPLELSASDIDKIAEDIRANAVDWRIGFFKTIYRTLF